MHKLVYSSSGNLARASPDTILFATGPQPAGFFAAGADSAVVVALTAASGTGVASREVNLAPPAAVETSAGEVAAAAGGEAAAAKRTSAGDGKVAATVLVVMN